MTTLAPFLRYPLHVQSWNRPAGNIDYRVTNPFGGVDLVNPNQKHQGVDIGNTRENDPLRAPVACEAYAKVHVDGAIGLIFDLGGGWMLELWHLNRTLIPKSPTYVSQGQLLGYTGSSGKVSGAHTHIELKLNGKAVDPAPYLPMVEREALSIPGATAGARFVDVPESHPFYPAIEYLSQKGYISGIGNARFAPDRAVTREELAAVLYRVLKTQEGG